MMELSHALPQSLGKGQQTYLTYAIRDGSIVFEIYCYNKFRAFYFDGDTITPVNASEFSRLNEERTVGESLRLP